MSTFAIRAIIVVSVFSGLFLLTFLPLWFKGVVANSLFNYYANKTTCTISSHNVVSGQCPFSCNPYTICTTGEDCTYVNGQEECTPTTTCNTYYNTCWQDCWDAYYTVTYWIYSISYEVYTSLVSSDDAYQYLNTNDPIGNNWVCFYDTRYPSDLRTSLVNIHPFYIAALFFAGFCIGCIFVWICIEGVIAAIKYRPLYTKLPCCNV
jgi:hypothetical protein